MHAEKNITKLNNFILNEVIGKQHEEKSIDISVRTKMQQRHFMNLMQQIASLSNDQMSVIVKDSFKKFKLVVQPSDGIYKSGTFLFTITLPNKYPAVAPHIKCDTLIYHPNIDDEGSICLSILDDWEPSVYDLTTCAQGLLFLFYNPNLEDPLSPFICSEMSYNDFERNVELSLKGGIIDGIRFPKNCTVVQHN